MKTALLSSAQPLSLLNKSFTQLNRPWLSGWVAFGLLILLSWQTASLLWLWLNPIQTSTLDTRVATHQQDGVIKTWSHLFPVGQQSVSTSHDHEAFADASLISGWQLLGVVVNEPFKLALIQQGASGSLLWLQEQQLTSQGVKVLSIQPTQVELVTRQGVKRLSLSSPADSIAMTSVSTTSTSSATVNLSSLRQQAKQNPALAMQWLNLQPQFENGRLVGVMVQAKAGQEAVFKQLGFMAGDRLVALNGQPMSEWMNKLASLPSLLDGAGASVKVLRAGKEQEWSVTW